MLKPDDHITKGGAEEEAAFAESYPCMVYDEAGYAGEFVCRHTRERFDVKSGYRESTGNFSIAAHQLLHQIDRGDIEVVGRIGDTWVRLQVIPNPFTVWHAKRGQSDTCFTLLHKTKWMPFRHEHNPYRASTGGGGKQTAG
jgi:hypothetical protein